METFASLVHSHELPLDPAKLEMLVALAQSNDEGQICYQELVDLVSGVSTSSCKGGLDRSLNNGGAVFFISAHFRASFLNFSIFEICELPILSVLPIS